MRLGRDRVLAVCRRQPVFSEWLEPPTDTDEHCPWVNGYIEPAKQRRVRLGVNVHVPKRGVEKHILADVYIHAHRARQTDKVVQFERRARPGAPVVRSLEKWFSSSPPRRTSACLPWS